MMIREPIPRVVKSTFYVVFKWSVKAFTVCEKLSHEKTLDLTSFSTTSANIFSKNSSFSLGRFLALINNVTYDPEVKKKSKILRKEIFAEVLIVTKSFIAALVHHPSDMAQQIGLWKYTTGLKCYLLCVMYVDCSKDYSNTPHSFPLITIRHDKFIDLMMKITGRIIFKTAFRCPHDTIIRSKYDIHQITRTYSVKSNCNNNMVWQK